MTKILRLDREIYKDPNSEKELDKKHALKSGSLLKLNHYLNKVLADADPENEVEEEYKNKHNQAFCWKFIRAVSYDDLSKFNNFVKRPSNITGGIEKMAITIHGEAKKREIDESKVIENSEHISRLNEGTDFMELK
jgi:hypothetical protein